MDRRGIILVTGATGYVGGRLIPVLIQHGYRVRALARRPDEARSQLPAEVEVVGGDLLEPGQLSAAFKDVDTAFYLVHSLESTGDLWEKEKATAENFAGAAEAAGVRRIVYLGGLGKAERLSPHLVTRHETGRILRGSRVPALELRSSIILGSGSLSFELIRALVERLPAMVAPRWPGCSPNPLRSRMS